jgi:Conserved region of Rad21 / Rec8 like protein
VNAEEEEVENVHEGDQDIEHARERRDDSSEIIASDQPDEIIGGNDPSFEMGYGNDNTIPFDDEDDRMPMPDDEPDNLLASESTCQLSSFYIIFCRFLITLFISPYLFFTGPAGRSQNSMESIFSLGATNEMDVGGGVDFDASVGDGEKDYDANTTSTSKWHKNTVKVFEVLKKNLISPDGDNNDDDDDLPKKEFVSYNALSDGVSRRTAAGFFFELLQLKTLNYIELNQNESYGDITISAGVKFTESPPSN